MPSEPAPAATPPARSAAMDAAAGGRRLLAYTVGCCVVGAGLALLAVTRVWSVQVTARPGLSDLRTTRTGGAELPWLPALALVALAGAGALLATRGAARRVVGLVLALVGLMLAAGGIVARLGLDAGSAAADATAWAVAVVAGAALVVLAGWWAVRYGHRWPAMGARYERRVAPDGQRWADRAGQAPANATRALQAPVDTRDAWDALDRGEDPTT